MLRGLTRPNFPEFWIASGDAALRFPDVTNFFRIWRLSKKNPVQFSGKWGRDLSALKFIEHFVLLLRIPASLCLRVWFCVSVSNCFVIFVFVSLSLCISVYPNLFLFGVCAVSLSVCLRFCLSGCLGLSLFVSMSLICLCLCVSAVYFRVPFVFWFFSLVAIPPSCPTGRWLAGCSSVSSAGYK